ncbi:MAG: S-layer homology domain-containing protein [Cyanobacteria bacterium P01_H01_bin.162]
MFTPSGPNRPTPRSPQDKDDWLAIFVALGTLGGLGGWLIFGGFPSLTTPLAETPDSATSPPAITDASPTNVGNAASGDGAIAVPEPTITPSPTSGEMASPNSEPAGSSASSPPPASATTATDSEGSAVPESPALVVPDPQIPESVSASSLPEIRPAIAFTDVAADNWAKPYIDALTARGVLNGLPDGSFAPNRPLTRAELATQVAQAFEVAPRTVSPGFTDVSADYWAADTIDEAVELGFMTGYPDRRFQPTQVVPRLQVLVTLATGLSLPQPTDATTLLQGYTDQNTIPAWGRDQVAAAIAAGLITPAATADSQLRPSDPATRAEVAALIHSALVYMGKVEPVE